MAEVTVERAIELGLEHHRAGRLAEAEGIYRQVLGRFPDHPEALHLLGALAGQVGKLEAGAELIRRAVALQPGNAVYQSNLGEAPDGPGEV